jgi:adenylate cyclase
VVLVSSVVQQRAAGRFHFRSVDRINPKGFAEAFDIFELLAERGNEDADDLEFCRDWEIVYAALHHGPLAAAVVELAAFAAKYPADGLARYYQNGSAGPPAQMSAARG